MRVGGLDHLARNAGEIAIQGRVAREERVSGAVGERGTTEPALRSEGGESESGWWWWTRRVRSRVRSWYARDGEESKEDR